MRITKVRAELYRIPVHREMHDAIRHFSKMDVIFAYIETDEGASGCGFTYSIIPHGAREICSIINNSFDELIRGMDPTDHERVWSQMWRCVDWIGRGGIAVLAIAPWKIGIGNLNSNLAPLPLNRMLGGHHARLPVYTTKAGWQTNPLERLAAKTHKTAEPGV